MRPRELIFGAIALLLVGAYAMLGSRVYTSVGPAVAPTPTPSAPRATQAASRALPGSIVFTIQGDVYVMREGKFSPLTSEGRNQQPAISADGATVAFSRREEIDGARIADGQRVNARLGYADIVLKPATGGAETIALSGLKTEARSGFHDVSWYLSPSFSPQGDRIAFLDAGDEGAADLVVYDLKTKRRTTYSTGSDLVGTAWSRDGKLIATTSYNTDVAGILLWTVDRPGTATRVKALPDGDAYAPSFSADGRWLLYTLRRDGRNDLHALELATDRDVALTSDGRSWNGAFSPDGQWIAFLRESGGTIDLHALELGDALAGGSPKASVKLTSGQGIDGTSRPAWGS